MAIKSYFYWLTLFNQKSMQKFSVLSIAMVFSVLFAMYYLATHPAYTNLAFPWKKFRGAKDNRSLFSKQ